MKSKKVFEHKFAVCVRNTHYLASLELRKIYEVMPDESASEVHEIRVIDESGDDYLYPENYFVAIDLPQAVGRALLKTS